MKILLICCEPEFDEWYDELWIDGKFICREESFLSAEKLLDILKGNKSVNDYLVVHYEDDLDGYDNFVEMKVKEFFDEMSQ